PLLFDDIAAGSVSDVIEATFGAGFTVSGAAGHATINFSGSPYTLAAKDAAGFTGHAQVTVANAATIETIYPLYVTTPGGTTADLHVLDASATDSGVVNIVAQQI